MADIILYTSTAIILLGVIGGFSFAVYETFKEMGWIWGWGSIIFILAFFGMIIGLILKGA